MTVVIGKSLKTSFLGVSLGLMIAAAQIGAQPVTRNPIVQVVKQHLGSITTVVTLDRDSQPLALGSGFFIDSKGSLVTNAHVVQKANSVVIRWQSQTKQAIRATRFDSRFDVVVLETGFAKTPFIPLGDSDSVLVGEEIVALGNPQGLEGTVSTGIVSGIRETPQRFLQITAPISPGSSGGPVLSTGGKVIGIATASLSTGQNLNFAVPVNLLKSLSPADLRFDAIKAPSAGNDDITTWNALVGRTNVMETIDHGILKAVTFSIQNDSSQTIRNLKALVVARNRYGQPFDFTFQDLSKYGAIPPRLAKQVRVDFFVTGYANSECSELGGRIYGSCAGRGNLEIRILDFAVARDSSFETLFKER